MKGKRNEIVVLVTFVLVFLLGASRQARSQDHGPSYRSEERRVGKECQ